MFGVPFLTVQLAGWQVPSIEGPRAPCPHDPCLPALEGPGLVTAPSWSFLEVPTLLTWAAWPGALRDPRVQVPPESDSVILFNLLSPHPVCRGSSLLPYPEGALEQRLSWPPGADSLLESARTRTQATGHRLERSGD